MKRLGFVLVCFAIWVPSAFAAPLCVTDTFAAYLALTAGECQIGDDIFSGFVITANNPNPNTQNGGSANRNPLVNGSSQVQPALVTVTPSVTGTGGVQLNFSVNSSSGGAPLNFNVFGTINTGLPQRFVDTIFYTVTAPSGHMLVSAQTNVNGGAVLTTATYSVATTLDSTPGTGVTVDNTTTNVGGVQTQIATILNPTVTLNILNTITLTSNGPHSPISSSFTTFDNILQAPAITTPEPDGLLLLGGGLVGLGLLLRRRAA